MKHFSISQYGLKIRFKLFGVLIVIYVCKWRKREKQKEVGIMRTTKIEKHEEKKQDYVVKTTTIIMTPEDNLPEDDQPNAEVKEDGQEKQIQE